MLRECLDRVCTEEVRDPDEEDPAAPPRKQTRYPHARRCCLPFVCCLDCGLWCVKDTAAEAYAKIKSMFCCLIFILLFVFIVFEWQLAVKLQQYGVDPPQSTFAYYTETTRSWSAATLHGFADMVHNHSRALGETVA